MLSAGFCWEDLVDTRVFSKEQLDLLKEKFKPTVKEVSSDVLDDLLSFQSEEIVKIDPEYTKLPEVAPTESSSHGIKYIKQALRILEDPNLDVVYAQEKMEHDAYVAAYERLKAEIEEVQQKTGRVKTSNMKFEFLQWQKSATEAIQSHINKFSSILQNSDPMKDSNFRANSMIKRISAEKSALITLVELFRINEYNPLDKAATVVSLADRIGRAMEKEIFADVMSKKTFLKQVTCMLIL